MRLRRPPAEILVVDNGSTDGTVEALRRHHPSVRVLQNPTNLGAALARNQGVLASEQPFVWFLDSDAEVVSADCLERMLARLEVDAGLGAIGGELIQNGPCLELKIHKSRRFGTGWVEFDPTLESGAVHRCRFVATANCCMSREVLADLGGFDPYYFYGAEDSDLGARLTQRGFNSAVSAETAILHHVSRVQDSRSLVRQERHRVRRAILYGPIWALPILPLLDTLALLVAAPHHLGRIARAPVGTVAALPEQLDGAAPTPAGPRRALARLLSLGRRYVYALVNAYLENLREIGETVRTRRTRPDFLEASVRRPLETSHT